MQETEFNDKRFVEIFKEETQSKVVDEMNDKFMELEQKGHKLIKRTFYKNMESALKAQKQVRRGNRCR